MAIGGIETLMQLGSLGEANFKAAKSQPLGSNSSKFVGLPKTLKNVVVFLGDALEENKVRFLLKVPTMIRFQEENGCLQLQFGL